MTVTLRHSNGTVDWEAGLVVSATPLGDIMSIAVLQGLTLAIPIGDGDSGVPGTMVEVIVLSKLDSDVPVMVNCCMQYAVLYAVCLYAECFEGFFVGLRRCLRILVTEITQ